MDGEDKMEMYLHSCRICLGKHAIKDILSTKRAYNINDVSCREMILSLFSIEVRAEDGLPNKLCLKCYSTICSAYNLKTVAISSQARLLRLKEEVKDECVVEEEGEVLPLEWVEEWSPARESAAPLHRKPSLETALFEEVNKENKEVAEPKKKRGRPPKKLAEDGQGEMKTVRKRGSKGEVCEQCGKVVMSLTTHLRSHSGTQPFPCSLCQRVFKNLSSRKRHHATHHLGQLYYCQICKKHFKNGPNHNLFMHSERTREHACVMCDKRFHTRARLQKHVSVHTKERPFPCTVCGKFFRTRMDSVYHRRSVHEKERSYVCQFCPRAFFSSTKLKEHLRMHTKEFAYFCKECGKGFSSSSGLRSHERHHSGRKDVPCILCGRAFASKGNLRSHMLTHTKERPYKCPHCEARFARSDHSKRHQRSAHRDLASDDKGSLSQHNLDSNSLCT